MSGRRLMAERGPQKATIVDVANAAGVSHSTVSRVLNGKRHISPTTRKRVLAAADDLGYVANLAARGLAGGKLGLVGLVVFDIESSYITQVVRGVDAALAEAGFDLMLCTTHMRERQERSYVSRLSVGLCDALLVLLPTSPDLYVDELAERNFPFVLLDHKGSPHANSVVARNHDGAVSAVEYLAGLGHRRIAHMAGDLGIGAAFDRLAGYRQVVADLGLDDDPDLVAEADFTDQASERAARELLLAANRPTAIFCASDASARVTIAVCREMGLDVPGDISVVGFDDIPEAALGRPALTTIAQPLREMGRQGVDLLMQRLEHPDRPVAHLVLSTELIIRESTGPVPT